MLTLRQETVPEKNVLLDLTNKPETFDEQPKSAFIQTGAPARRRRQVLSASICLLASFIWIVALWHHGSCLQALPWYITIAGLALVPVREMFKPQGPPLAFGPKTTEPVSFFETYSSSYLAAALLLLGMACAKFEPVNRSVRHQQVVDIQLISPKDYHDEHSPLPASKPAEELRKRLADMKTVQGSLSAQSDAKAPASKEQKTLVHQEEPPKPIQSQGASKQKQTGESEQEQQEDKVEPVVADLPMPSTWATKSFKPAAAQASLQQVSMPPVQESYLSEVEPPEMVELIENDGDNQAMTVYQKGGRSAGGTGAENGLSAYLKRLHRRIKLAWTPPRGVQRRVELTFRLNKDGRLEFVRVSQSSGQTNTDSSTTAAVRDATRVPEALPADFGAPYLDIVYTFRYNVDELKEITNVSSPTPNAFAGPQSAPAGKAKIAKTGRGTQ